LSPANTIVESEDRLLIYYGTGTFEEVLLNFYPQVSRSAIEFNGKEDPASCSSNAQKSLIDGFVHGISKGWKQLKEQLPHTHTAEDAH
jgi:hypothetical protein